MADDTRKFRATDGLHYLGGTIGPDLHKRNQYLLAAAAAIRKAAAPNPKKAKGN